MMNVNTLAAVFNGANILLCIGMAVYSVKWLRLFREGKFQKAIQALVVSVFFFLIAAIARAALIWQIFTAELEYVDIFIRFFAFLFLFVAIVLTVRQWTSLGK